MGVPSVTSGGVWSGRTNPLIYLALVGVCGVGWTVQRAPLSNVEGESEGSYGRAYN